MDVESSDVKESLEDGSMTFGPYGNGKDGGQDSSLETVHAESMQLLHRQDGA